MVEEKFIHGKEIIIHSSGNNEKPTAVFSSNPSKQ
jgi:hypothetical protein